MTNPLASCLTMCDTNRMDTTAAPTDTRTFQVGQTTSATSVCDSECVWTFVVTKRTAKFVTLRDAYTGDTYRVGVKVGRDGNEYAMPFGSYSMAPLVRAA